jgi:hemerythrin-like metal-binding protein
MANLMTWGMQMSVGNLVIDSGHQDLIGMINSLEYAIRQGDRPQAVRIFQRFRDFAHLHFSDEEKIMQAVKFPFIPHKLEHQYLLDELQDTLEKLAAEAEYSLDHYPEFLRNWFASHINNGAATLKPVLQGYPYDFMPV